MGLVSSIIINEKEGGGLWRETHDLTNFILNKCNVQTLKKILRLKTMNQLGKFELMTCY